MSRAQKNQFEQQYNDALNGDNAENQIPSQPSLVIHSPGESERGNEPMTEEQRSYLELLVELHGETMEANLTRAQAATLINSKMQNITIPSPGENGSDFWQSLKNPEHNGH